MDMREASQELMQALTKLKNGVFKTGYLKTKRMTTSTLDWEVTRLQALQMSKCLAGVVITILPIVTLCFLRNTNKAKCNEPGYITSNMATLAPRNKTTDTASGHAQRRYEQ